MRQTNELFGGRFPEDITVSNIVYINGAIDPWSSMGAVVDQSHHNDNNLVDVVVVKEGSHCQDMYPGVEVGWPEMAAAKELVVDRIQRWLD